MNNNGPLDVNGELRSQRRHPDRFRQRRDARNPQHKLHSNSIAVVLDAVTLVGTIVHLENAAGETVLTYESPKDFQLFVFSSPDLQMNTTYTLYVGGDSNRYDHQQRLTPMENTPRHRLASLEITSNVTTQGNFESGRGGKGPGN